MIAVVVANGELDWGDDRRVAEADVVIAADGGALAAAAAGRLPSVIAGDLDSLVSSPEIAAAIRAGTVALEERSPEKDETDTEIALGVALAHGARRIVLVGATGGPRLDHEVANLLLVADPAHRGSEVCLARGPSRVRALHGGDRLVLEGRDGDTVSLLPVGGDATGVRTTGLAYPLDGETLRFGRARGVSNRVVAAPASVELEDGILLVVETATADAPGAAA